MTKDELIEKWEKTSEQLTKYLAEETDINDIVEKALISNCQDYINEFINDLKQLTS
jgi:hypothetical protein